LRECTQNDDVTGVEEAADTREEMTCCKYGWSAGDATQLFSSNEHHHHRQQQQQQAEDAAGGDDCTGDTEDQPTHNRY